jgi:hypothetical protein
MPTLLLRRRSPLIESLDALGDLAMTISFVAFLIALFGLALAFTLAGRARDAFAALPPAWGDALFLFLAAALLRGPMILSDLLLGGR